MLFRFWTIFLVIILFVGTLRAQEIDKVCPETNLGLRLNTEIFLENGSFIFYESNWQLGQNQLYRKLNSLPFYQMFHLVGYEMPLNERWSGGLGIRQNYFKGLKISAFRGHLNHNSKISKFVFFKELSLEHFWRNNDQKPYNRAGLRMILGRDWEIKKHKVRSVIGYDLFKEFEAESLAKNRRFQQSNLRIGADYFLKNNLSLGIYYDKENSYFFADEQYIPNVITGELLKIPARKLNVILPTWSIRLHWQWLKNKEIQKRMIF